MADTTRIGAAQDALLTLLEARGALSAVPVDLGFPVKGPQKEHIWISGQVPDWTQGFLTTGPVTGASAALREESFTLKVIIVVSWHTTSYVQARDRALALALEVERTVLANDTLSGTVFQAQMGRGRIAEGIGTDFRQVVPELDIECDAHLGG